MSSQPKIEAPNKTAAFHIYADLCESKQKTFL